MKKITAILLALIMLLSLSSCTSSNVNGKIETENETENTTEENTGFSVGTVSGGKYTNEYFGIGCELGEDWVFANEDEIRQLNEKVIDNLGEVLGDDYEMALEDAPYVTDMLASNQTTASSININIENSGPQGLLMSVDDYMDAADKDLADTLYGLGIDNLSVERATYDFAGKTQKAFKVTGDYLGLDFEEILLVIKKGARFVSISITSYFGNAEEILDLFYAVD